MEMVRLKAVRFTVVAFSALFAVVSLGLAQTTPDTPTAGLTDNPVYQKNCAKCHGKTAEGRHFGGPSLLSEKIANAPADELRNIVTNGKGRMPKFTGKLAAIEIDMLLEQIKTTPAKSPHP